MESPEEIKEADGYVLGLSGIETFSYLHFNHLQCCIQVDKLYKHRLFLSCCFLGFLHLQF